MIGGGPAWVAEVSAAEASGEAGLVEEVSEAEVAGLVALAAALLVGAAPAAVGSERGGRWFRKH